MEHQLLKVESDDEIETSEEPSDDSELEDEAFEADENEEPTHLFNDELKMPPYEHAKRQLSQLIDLMNGPYLDLSPDYQRNVVWSGKAMRLLIDSMWKGYYIPPVIFNIETVEDENGVTRFKRTCVDGKQRLTAIRDFMNGLFPCRINKRSWYFCNPSNRAATAASRLILPESARAEFRKMELLCTEYKGLSRKQELEIFQRVQLGKPLSQAEAFRATEGDWQDLARFYEEEFSDVVNLVITKRASGFKVLLLCFMQICQCNNRTGADGMPKFNSSIRTVQSFCSNTATLTSATKEHLRFVFSVLQDLVKADRSIFDDKNYPRRKTFASIELIAVCCLISQKGAERPRGMLRDDIIALRSYLRQRCPGLPLSIQGWSMVWEFIVNLENHRGATNGSKKPVGPKKSSKKIKRISHPPRLIAPTPLSGENSHRISSPYQRHDPTTPSIATTTKPSSNPPARKIHKRPYLKSKTLAARLGPASRGRPPPTIRRVAHRHRSSESGNHSKPSSPLLSHHPPPTSAPASSTNAPTTTTHLPSEPAPAPAPAPFSTAKRRLSAITLSSSSSSDHSPIEFFPTRSFNPFMLPINPSNTTSQDPPLSSFLAPKTSQASLPAPEKGLGGGDAGGGGDIPPTEPQPGPEIDMEATGLGQEGGVRIKMEDGGGLGDGAGFL